MKLRYMREARLEQLRIDLDNNIELYKQTEPWLSNHFQDNNWFLTSSIPVEDIELIQSEDGKHFDLENTKILYNAYKHLNIIQATDERLWVYLTHSNFWQYMRSRWPVENYIGRDNPAQNLRERYFFITNKDRALTRNGVSRLWWYGYVSYDENRDDPFELTQMLLSKLDLAGSLLERRFSRNPIVVRAILSVLVENEKADKPFPSREKIRELMKYINQLGGVTIIDALDQADISKIVFDKLEMLA